MEIWQKQIPFTASSSITKELLSKSSLLFDIETTGFSATNNHVCLIGCAAKQEDALQFTQFFAKNAQEEKEILSAFLQKVSHYKSLVSFNGLSFDVPFLQGRCARYQLEETLDAYPHLDIYKQLSDYKDIFKLPNMKQKTLESFIEIERKDLCTGGDFIKIYQEYVKHPSKEGCSLLLLHNYEDLLGMTGLISLLAYPRFFSGQFQAITYEKNLYTAYDGAQTAELLLTLSLDHALPQPFSLGKDDIYLKGFQNKAILKIPIYQGELKYFYPNYKDYYYLPKEDRAIHKSVAFYVDKDFRTSAKAATCYSKKTGCFLPQHKEIVTPCFKTDYHDKDAWFEMTEDFLESEKQMKKYILHILTHIAGSKSLSQIK